MSDLFDDPSPGANEPEFSVSDISGAVKRTIEGAFSRVRVRGEVGRVSKPYSGHIYFDLKDDKSVLSAVAWKGVAARLRTLPEEGMEVVATGKITTFGGQSKYQMVIDTVAPAGAGALMVMLEKRRKALAAEGLFAAERKRPLPYLPQVIGVVTSPSGAVIRDILHRLRDRFPREVLVWPVAVQGEKCAQDVAQAIAGFNAMTAGGAMPRPDVLIVARGGGSLEDLWGFNEEIVVRAAAGSDIPLISAVGHETDTTLIDYASDKRAPTPTAAAELAVPVRMDLLGQVTSLEERRISAAVKMVRQKRERLRDLARALPRPEAMLNERAQRYDTFADRLPRALAALGAEKRVRLGERTGRFGPGLLSQNLRLAASKLERLAEGLSPARSVGLLRERRTRLAALAQGLAPARIAQLTRGGRDRLHPVSRAFSTAMQTTTQRNRERLTMLDKLRETLSYQGTLKRGYAIVRDGDGQVLSDAATAKKAAGLEIEFRDGRMKTGAGNAAEKKAPDKTPGKSSGQKSGKSSEQGDLF